MAVLVDTSVLYALARRDDPSHARCEEAIATEPGGDHHPGAGPLRDRLPDDARIGTEAERTFLRSLFESDWGVEPMSRTDFSRALELLEHDASADIGFADAATVAIAERLDVRRIYTLDRREFALVRPAHVPAFELLP